MTMGLLHPCLAADRPRHHAWDSDANPRARLGWLGVTLLLVLTTIGGRLWFLQHDATDRFAATFAETHQRYESLPTRDGRILAADGVVLATDDARYDLMIQYRWLEEPPNPRWLRQKAWQRLAPKERRKAAAVAAAEQEVLELRRRLWDELVGLTGFTAEELEQRRAPIQQRLTRLRQAVEEKRGVTEPKSSAAVAANPRTGSVSAPTPGGDWRYWWQLMQQELQGSGPRPQRDAIVLREELEAHLLVENLSPERAAEIEAHPERYPGLSVRTHLRRTYPQRDLAAHLLGHRTPIDAAEASGRSEHFQTGDPLDVQPGDRLGRSGLEAAYDIQLRGLRGERKVTLTRRQSVLAEEVTRPAQFGRDLILTIDSGVQRQLEQRLDQLLIGDNAESVVAADSVVQPAPGVPPQPPPVGGAVVAIDVHSGAVLVAASAPRFDNNLLIQADPEVWRQLSDDPRKPFYPRVTKMAIAPGSTFKIVTAVAGLESGWSADRIVDCVGYLDSPDKHRCLSYRHFGVGHGETTLDMALARSCNVYFFQMARKSGGAALTDWAERLGLGRPTGIDVPGEATGRVPRLSGGNRQSTKDDSLLAMAIGQSRLQVTPLQMARCMAAIANGGRLVTPRLVSPATRFAGSQWDATEAVSPDRTVSEATQVPGLSAQTLTEIRQGLELTVQDPRGTAYRSARSRLVAIAGKTGTAETGGGQPDHAWFVGYAPAHRPRVAFCVVLEHGGSGGRIAGPVGRELVEALAAAGYLGSSTTTETAAAEQ